MDMKKTVAVVPVKLNNERLPGKNTKPFHNGQPLITYILKTLKQVKGLDGIYVYCSDPSIRDYLPEGVTYLPRDKKLDLSSTSILDVLLAFASDVPAENYVLAHATAPFLSADSIQKGLDAVVHGGHDSAMAVRKLRDFLWKDGVPLYDTRTIPRTQDLGDLYAETTGLYVYTRALLTEQHRRTGDKPFLVPVSDVEATDINEPFDFMMADLLYNELLREGGAAL